MLEERPACPSTPDLGAPRGTSETPGDSGELRSLLALNSRGDRRRVTSQLTEMESPWEGATRVSPSQPGS